MDFRDWIGGRLEITPKMWLYCVCIIAILATLWYFSIHGRRRKLTSKERVILFSRFPEAGKTKTRLIGVLGEAGSARLQLYMSDHILDVLSEFLHRRADAAVEAKLTGGTGQQLDYWLGRKRFPQQRFSWSLQSDGDLGLKMADAFSSAFNEGSDYAVIIGADIPAINADILESALVKLSSPECQMVLGPAKDGGYYLIGLRCEVKRKLGVLADLFDSIEWSTSTVCQRQVEVATRLGTKVELLPQVLQDVDIPDDLVDFERELGISVEDLKAPRLSIVIPSLNEVTNIEGALQSIKENSSWSSYVEVIVSDGGSTDGTLMKVDEFSKRNPEMQIKTVQGDRGRGRQMNAGAQEATGVNILFLHADTRLPLAFDRHVLLTLAVPGNVAGAFKLAWDVLRESGRKDCSWWLKIQLQLVLLSHWISYKLNTENVYGDQAMFMSRRIFNRVGCFPPYLLMEDYAMYKKVQEFGHLSTVQDASVVVSARRIIRKGLLKVTLVNLFMVLGYHIGIHPDTLGHLYYG